MLDFLKADYAANLKTVYKIDETVDLSAEPGYELLEMIGRKRGCIVSGGEIDTFRAANLILDDFRAAKIGRITLELPEDGEERPTGATE